MKVKELIEMLKQQDQELKVYYHDLDTMEDHGFSSVEVGTPNKYNKEIVVKLF
jgi:hypothetical protein